MIARRQHPFFTLPLMGKVASTRNKRFNRAMIFRRVRSRMAVGVFCNAEPSNDHPHPAASLPLSGDPPRKGEGKKCARNFSPFVPAQKREARLYRNKRGPRSSKTGFPLSRERADR